MKAELSDIRQKFRPILYMPSNKWELYTEWIKKPV